MSKNNSENYDYIAIFKKYWSYCPYEIAKKAEYSGKYQVISMDKLNELILSSKELFYYVNLYSGHDSSKGIIMNSMTVTNGLKGDIIFKDYELTRDSFSPSLIKTLSKLIQKLNKLLFNLTSNNFINRFNIQRVIS